MVDGLELMLLGALAAITYAMGLWTAPPPPSPLPPPPPPPPPSGDRCADLKAAYDQYVAQGTPGEFFAKRTLAQAKAQGCEWAMGDYPYQPPPPPPPGLEQDSVECKRLWEAYVAFRRNGDSTAAYMVREDARKRLGCKWANGGTPVRLRGGLAGAAGTALGGISPFGATGTPTATGTAPTSPGGGGTSGGARLIL